LPATLAMVGAPPASLAVVRMGLAPADWIGFKLAVGGAILAVICCVVGTAYLGMRARRHGGSLARINDFDAE